MEERPILFSTDMVQAILDGRKTQTRRVIKNLDLSWRFNGKRFEKHMGHPVGHDLVKCPYGEPGDLLWVRETWGAVYHDHESGLYLQHPDVKREFRTKANCEGVEYKADGNFDEYVGIPSIFMPRWASRITLRVTNVRVERVRDISEKDVIAEGLDCATDFSDDCVCADKWTHKTKHGYWERPKVAFSALWDSINKKRGYGWDKNPWVWVVEFEQADGQR